MPAGMVRPLASQVPKLSARVLAEAREKGWEISESGTYGRPGQEGPCAGCGATTKRYGVGGSPLCVGCRSDAP